LDITGLSEGIANQMHTVGRASGDQPIGKLFCQSLFDQANCGFDKKLTGIWKKEIGANPADKMER
jgi:hypothetical protein